VCVCVYGKMAKEKYKDTILFSITKVE